MEIQFCLAWLKSGTSVHKAFKLASACSLFLEYIDRISRFTPCRVKGAISDVRKSGMKVWICDRSSGSEAVSSENLALNLEKIQDSGTRQLEIVIGGPDGISKSDLEMLKPDWKWSFGLLTLPHELAAVIASEQIYRAWTIIRKMPYHLSH